MFCKACFLFASRRRHTRCGRDWSSDVCSSDLRSHEAPHILPRERPPRKTGRVVADCDRTCVRTHKKPPSAKRSEIGRAACRGRGENSGVAGSLKKKKKK